MTFHFRDVILNSAEGWKSGGEVGVGTSTHGHPRE